MFVPNPLVEVPRAILAAGAGVRTSGAAA